MTYSVEILCETIQRERHTFLVCAQYLFIMIYGESRSGCTHCIHTIYSKRRPLEDSVTRRAALQKKRKIVPNFVRENGYVYLGLTVISVLGFS